MNRSTHMTRLAGALIAGGLVLTGCSSSSGDSAASSSSSSRAGFNDADVSFAQGMLPHHEQAVEMADMVGGRTGNAQIIDLASRIKAAQGPELDTLTSWLTDWGQDVPTDSDMSGMDHGGPDIGDGMMSAEDMDALEAASGPGFDQLFLSQMIEHHTGAVDMAQTEIADGEFTDAVAMARDIVDSQSAEITEMEQLLTSLGG